MKERSLFSVPSPEFIICRVFNDGHLKLTVVLLCIFLIISNVEHLIMYLLAICMSSLEKCLFTYSFIFVGGCFILFDTELCELSILEIKPLLAALFAKFPPFHSLSFHFVYSFLFMQKLLSLKYLHIFSSRSFMVSYLIFKSLGILGLFLCMVWRSVLISLIYMKLSSFPNTICWWDCLIYIVYSCLLCLKVTIVVWVYFWVLCSFPLISMFVFVPIPSCFNHCGFVVLCEFWEGYAFVLCSFSLGLLWQFWIFYGSILMWFLWKEWC